VEPPFWNVPLSCAVGEGSKHFTIAWNALEGLVAVVAGAVAGSISLVGLESIASSKSRRARSCCGECPLTQRFVNVNETRNARLKLSVSVSWLWRRTLPANLSEIYGLGELQNTVCPE